MNLFGPPQGSLTPDTIHVGQRVVVHFRLQPDVTGTVLAVCEPWANIDIDGYDGMLQSELLIEEMDPL